MKGEAASATENVASSQARSLGGAERGKAPGARLLLDGLARAKPQPGIVARCWVRESTGDDWAQAAVWRVLYRCRDLAKQTMNGALDG